MKHLIAIICIVFFSTIATAEDFPFTDGINTRAQLGSKAIGITIIASCPFQSVVNKIKKRGRDMGRAIGLPDGSIYTVFLPVIGQENCPANLYGSVSPDIEKEEIDNLTSFKFGFGVTVGVHYRDFR